MVTGCEILPPVFSPELQGFLFEANGGKVDYSLTRSIWGRQELPPDYSDYEKETWRGVHFQNSSLRLPEEYDFSDSGQSFLLKGSSLFIDDNGLTGHFSGEDLVALQEGRLGEWPCSLDQLTLDIRNNEIMDSRLQGKLGVPILTEAFSFEGRINLLNKEGDMELRIDLQGVNSGLPMWGGTINLADQSQAQVILRELEGGGKAFTPSASLYGLFFLDFTNEEVEGLLSNVTSELRNKLQTSLDIDHLALKLEDLELRGVKLRSLC